MEVPRVAVEMLLMLDEREQNQKLGEESGPILSLERVMHFD